MNHSTIKVRDFLIECPNCHRQFLKMDMRTVELEVNLNDTINTYYYCGESCFQQKVEKLNSQSQPFEPKLVLDYKEKVSDNPIKWLFICKAEYPEVQLLN